MYRELTAADLRDYLNVSKEYHVDALLTFGSYSKIKPWQYFEKALNQLGIQAVYEPLKNDFFGDIKCLVTPQGRLWFEVIYGCAYASEVVHVASLLGAKAIIHIGVDPVY